MQSLIPLLGQHCSPVEFPVADVVELRPVILRPHRHFVPMDGLINFALKIFTSLTITHNIVYFFPFSVIINFTYVRENNMETFIKDLIKKIIVP